MRKKDQEISKKMLLAQSLGSTKRETPRLSWKDEVKGDARMFGIRNCWMVPQDHDE